MSRRRLVRTLAYSLSRVPPLGLFLLGCSPPPVAVAPVVKPAPSRVVAAVSSPARWWVRPDPNLPIAGTLDFDGATLFVAESGARFLSRPGASPELTQAPDLLGANITSIGRREGELLFFTANGEVLVAKEPLGPVIETRKPALRLRRLSAGKNAVVAIADTGIVRSTDGGKSWVAVSIPKSPGKLADVLLSRTGEGLAVFAPQRLLRSNDDGATWVPLASNGLGALSLGIDEAGTLQVEGLTGHSVFAVDKLERRAGAMKKPLSLPATEIPATPLAHLVRLGKAALDEDRVYEPGEDADKNPTLTKRRLDGVAEAPISLPALCIGSGSPSGPFVTAKGKAVVAGCEPETSTPEELPSWRVLRSEDEGKSFAADGDMPLNIREDRRLRTLPDGTILFDGSCKSMKSSATGDARPDSCTSSAPVIRVGSGSARVVTKVTDAFGVAFWAMTAKDEQHVYALAGETSGRVSLLTSNNGGKSFRRGAPLPGILEPGDTEPNRNITNAATLGLDRDGHPVILMPGNKSLLRWVSHDEGASYVTSLLDLAVSHVDLSGRRGLAMDLEAIYETADGGESFTKVKGPEVRLASGYPPERLIACESHGCVVGNDLRRGWDLKELDRGPVTALASTPPKPVLRKGLVCEAVDGWKPPFETSALPSIGAHDLGGEVRWALPSRDPKTGSVTAVAAFSGKKGLEQKTIALVTGNKPIPPTPPAKPGAPPAPLAAPDVVTAVVAQMEGTAAIRYVVKREAPPKDRPRDKPKISRQTVDVEVAFWLAETNHVHRATIKAAGTIDPVKDVRDTDAPLARFSLLSITAGGIYLRPFASSPSTDPLYFVGHDGKIEKLAWPDVPVKNAEGKSIKLSMDVARVGKENIVFGRYASVLWLARGREGGGFDTNVWALAPQGLPQSPTFGFFDSGKVPLLGLSTISVRDPVPSGGAWAVSIPITPGVDPVNVHELPVWSSLADPEPGCVESKGASKLGARIVSRQGYGARHPVELTMDSDRHALLTDEGILRVAKDGKGCASAMLAHKPEFGSLSASPNQVWLSIHPGDLEHATAFRAKGKVTGEAPTWELTARSVKCHYGDFPLPKSLETFVPTE